MDYDDDFVLSEDGETLYLKKSWVFDIGWKEKRKLKGRIKKFLRENVTGGKRVRGRPFPFTKYKNLYEFWSGQGKKRRMFASIDNTPKEFKTDDGTEVSTVFRFYGRPVCGRLYDTDTSAKEFFNYVKSKGSGNRI